MDQTITDQTTLAVLANLTTLTIKKINGESALITLVAILFPFTLIFILHIGRPVHRDSLIFIHIPLPITQISPGIPYGPLKIIFSPKVK